MDKFSPRTLLVSDLDGTLLGPDGSRGHLARRRQRHPEVRAAANQVIGANNADGVASWIAPTALTTAAFTVPRH